MSNLEWSRNHLLSIFLWLCKRISWMSIIAPTIQICRQRSSKTHNECSDFSVKCERSKEKYAKNFFITEMEHLIQWGRICDLYNLRFGNFRKKWRVSMLQKLSDWENWVTGTEDINQKWMQMICCLSLRKR